MVSFLPDVRTKSSYSQPPPIQTTTIAYWPTDEIYVSVSVIHVGLARGLQVTARDDGVEELERVLLVGDRRSRGLRSRALTTTKAGNENRLLKHGQREHQHSNTPFAL